MNNIIKEHEDLRNKTNDYFNELAKKYTYKIFKKKFLFGKILACENENIIFIKRKMNICININSILYYSFSVDHRNFTQAYTIYLVLSDSYIRLERSNCIEYQYLLINLNKKMIKYEEYNSMYSRLKSLKKYVF